MPYDSDNFEQMLEGIIEEHELKFFGIFRVSIKVLHALVRPFLQELNVVDGLVVSRTKLNDGSFFIAFISNQIVCKSKELIAGKLLVNFCFHTEALDGDVINGV